MTPLPRKKVREQFGEWRKTLKGLGVRGCKRGTQITSVSWSSTETLFVPEVIHYRNTYPWYFSWNLHCSVSSLIESHERL